MKPRPRAGQISQSKVGHRHPKEELREGQALEALQPGLERVTGDKQNREAGIGNYQNMKEDLKAQGT